MSLKALSASGTLISFSVGGIVSAALCQPVSSVRVEEPVPTREGGGAVNHFVQSTNFVSSGWG